MFGFDIDKKDNSFSLYIVISAQQKLDLLLSDYNDYDNDYLIAAFPKRDKHGTFVVKDFIIPKQFVWYYRSSLNGSEFRKLVDQNKGDVSIPMLGYISPYTNADFSVELSKFRDIIGEMSTEYILFSYVNRVFSMFYYNDETNVIEHLSLNSATKHRNYRMLVQPDLVKKEIEENVTITATFCGASTKSATYVASTDYSYAPTTTYTPSGTAQRPITKAKPYVEGKINKENPEIFSIIDEKSVNLEGFKLILMSDQENLRRYFDKVLVSLYNKDNVRTTSDYIYAQGTIPVMLVAHMDIKHFEAPSEIYHDQEKSVLWSPTGIGGDDRCGLYILFAVLKSCKEGEYPSVLLTTDEETGCWGAKAAATELIEDTKDLKYLVELDRRNSKDVVFYDTTNEEFHKFAQSFGFTKCEGFGSDIKYLTQKWGIASCNVSVGYYNEHQFHEYIKMEEMMFTIPKVVRMVQEAKNAPCYKDK